MTPTDLTTTDTSAAEADARAARAGRAPDRRTD